MEKFYSRFFIIFLTSILWTSFSLPYVTSAALWQKGNKKIGVFGDAHIKNEPDVCHRNLFMPFLEQLAEGNQKIEFILEHVLEESVKETKNPLCMEYFSQYAFEHKLKKGPLTFILSDIRSEFPAFNEIVRGVYVLLLGLGTNDPNFIITGLQNSKKISTQEALEEVKAALDAIREFKKKVTLKEAQQFFNDIEQKLTKFYKKLGTFFKKYNHEATIAVGGTMHYTFSSGTIMASFLEAAEEGNFSEKTLNHLLNSYIEPVLGDIVNFAFIRDIMGSQERVDASLVYGGNAHTTIINRFLLDLGYTFNQTVSVGPIFQEPEAKVPPVTENELEKFFAAFLK
jgi:hypothetical protein